MGVGRGFLLSANDGADLGGRDSTPNPCSLSLLPPPPPLAIVRPIMFRSSRREWIPAHGPSFWGSASSLHSFPSRLALCQASFLSCPQSHLLEGFSASACVRVRGVHPPRPGLPISALLQISSAFARLADEAQQIVLPKRV